MRWHWHQPRLPAMGPTLLPGAYCPQAARTQGSQGEVAAEAALEVEGVPAGLGKGGFLQEGTPGLDPIVQEKQ